MRETETYRDARGAETRAGVAEARALAGFLSSLAQIGQPYPRCTRVRTCACHSWPAEQHHQYFLGVPAVTSVGLVFPFFLGCHSRATAGATAAREFVEEARCPAQNGHPAPTATAWSP